MKSASTSGEAMRLEDIAEKSIYGKGLSRICAQYCGQIFLKHMIPGSVLELGPAEGMMTDVVYPYYKQDYTVVEGSSIFSDLIRKSYPNTHVFNCLFEDFVPARKFSNILLGHVLEHVADPAYILKRCLDWLEDDAGGESLRLCLTPAAFTAKQLWKWAY